MADFKLIKAPQATATGVSVTSGFTIPTEFTHFSLYVPPSSGWCVTTTCNIFVQGATSIDGTYYDVGYSQNPATATSGFPLCHTANSVAVSGGFVIFEGPQFIPFMRLRFSNTITVAAGGWQLYGRKFD